MGKVRRHLHGSAIRRDCAGKHRFDGHCALQALIHALMDVTKSRLLNQAL
jgi:hypothetical protein